MMSWSFKSFAETGQYVTGHDNVDADGNPAGGWAQDGVHDYQRGLMPQFLIRWQDGPLDRQSGAEPNGAFVEDVLEACKRRIAFYQDSRFACEDNAEAIAKIEDAIAALTRRREDRRERGVLGRNEE